MWNPLRRKPSAFETELAAVKELPEPTPAMRGGAFDAPQYGQIEPAQLAPVRQENRQTLLAAPPIIDRFPVIIGQELSGQYLSTAFRLANSGWRFQYVDLLDELLENDPDARAVVRARILGVACGRYTVEPAELGENASDADRELAKTLAAEFKLQFDNIPYRKQRLQQLAWADWYGVGAHEIIWEHPSSNRWDIAGLSHIHNRRLNYSNPVSWELHIYDQGLVGPGSDYMGPTVGSYGLPVSKYPGKFLVHTPCLSAQYATRDGEGRYVAFFMLLKRMVTRCSAQDFERVIRPWVIGYFNRSLHPNTTTPVADDKDIKALNEALAAFGSGSMNAASLPSSVKVELLRAVSAMAASEFLSFLNRSIAKALLGQAFTTEPGPNGNLATAEVANDNTDVVLGYSADTLAETLRYGLAVPWLWANHSAISRHFAPRIVADISRIPKPSELVAMAKDMTEMDCPIDMDDLARRTGQKILAADDTIGRRTRMITAKEGPNPPNPAKAPKASVIELAKPGAKPRGALEG